MSKFIKSVPCEDKTILPFKKFFVDLDGGISSLFYPSDEKRRGNLFFDGGFTKVYHNFKKLKVFIDISKI